MTTGQALENYLRANWVGWQEAWDSEYIPFQEAHGYPAHVVVEWCGGLLMNGIWETGGQYGVGGGVVAPNCWHTPSGAAGFQAIGRWSTTPRLHSFIFFDWDGTGLGNNVGVIDHIGLVTGPVLLGPDGKPVVGRETDPFGNPVEYQMIDMTAGYVDTIEGNVNERCGRFRRWFSTGVIKGFGHPRYTAVKQETIPPSIVVPDLQAIRRVLAATSAVAAAT